MEEVSPCPTLCLQGRAETKLRDSQEQLVKLCSAWAASKPQAIPWVQNTGQPLILARGTTEEAAGTAEPSTWGAHTIGETPQGQHQALWYMCSLHGPSHPGTEIPGR